MLWGAPASRVSESEATGYCGDQIEELKPPAPSDGSLGAESDYSCP